MPTSFPIPKIDDVFDTVTDSKDISFLRYCAEMIAPLGRLDAIHYIISRVRLRHTSAKKWCTRLAAANDKVYQLLVHGRWF